MAEISLFTPRVRAAQRQQRKVDAMKRRWGPTSRLNQRRTAPPTVSDWRRSSDQCGLGARRTIVPDDSLNLTLAEFTDRAKLQRARFVGDRAYKTLVTQI